MNYSEMSDQEINIELTAKVLGIDDYDVSICETGIYDGEEHEVKDYCGSWECMGPLIVKHEIAILPYMTNWEAFYENMQRTIKDPNPLRAAAICLLMLLDKGEQVCIA